MPADQWFSFDEEAADAIRGRPVIATFPGPGLVGGIAGEELVESLGARPLAPVRSERLSAQAIVTDGRPEWPIVLYDAGRVVVLRCDVDVEGVAAHRLARETLAFLDRAGASCVIVLEGVAVDAMPPEGGAVYGVTRDARLGDAFSRASAEPLEDAVLTGPAAALLLWGSEADAPPVGALLTGAAGGMPDPRAAARVLETLNRALALHVDVGELSERANELEREVHRLSREAGIPLPGGHVARASEDSGMYT